MRNMQDVHQPHKLLSAEQVRRMLGVDRSTVYRMAENGRLPAVKIGRQWRFPTEQIESMLGAHSPAGIPAPVAPGRRALLLSLRAATPLVELAAQILGVMLVITDMDGEPLTGVINPCPWFSAHAGEPGMLAECLADWKVLADDPDFDIRFRTGPLNFDCARAFIRLGPQLIGMLVAGGLDPSGDDPRALYRLSPEGRERALAALPIIAAKISRISADLFSDLGTRSME
jgi:excisionase family DNA binding protein